LTLVQLALPLGAAFIGGAMNSVAGGGSFLTFPALIFAGVPPIPANATNNAAMWVGVIGAARGYREEVREYRRFLAPVIAVSVVGSLIGSILLLRTPSLLFERLIPFLLLFATVVFAVSPLLNRRTAGVAFQARGHNRWQLAVQFCVAIYGGYFGAGMGILMLAILAFSGLPTLNAQNGIKNVLSVSINGVALIPFVLARVVDWRFAIPMAVIALAGGYFGARLFRRVPPRISRVLVIAIGLTMTAVFMRRLL
jgi:uncharacterized membrane protein YfcA